MREFVLACAVIHAVTRDAALNSSTTFSYHHQ